MQLSDHASAFHYSSVTLPTFPSTVTPLYELEETLFKNLYHITKNITICVLKCSDIPLTTLKDLWCASLYFTLRG